VSGQLYIISAPSGAGKSSLLNALMTQLPRVKLSISTTTRDPRPGEVDGEHYHFISVPDFEQQVQAQAFYEYAQVFDNYYGTSKPWVQSQLEQGYDVILEIDWQGAQQMRKQLDAVLTVFILPPSVEALQQRLQQRGQDSDDVIAKRMNEARSEMSHYNEYDYVIINDQFEQAVDEIKAVFLANRVSLAKQTANPLLIQLIQS
jgi:guanylate kinase